MAKSFYREGLDQFMAEGNALSDTMKAYLVTSAYTFVATHGLSDIAGQIGNPATLTGVTVTDGATGVTVDCDDIVWVSPPASQTVAAVIYTITVGGGEKMLLFDDGKSLVTDGSNVNGVPDATNSLFRIPLA